MAKENDKGGSAGGQGKPGGGGGGNNGGGGGNAGGPKKIIVSINSLDGIIEHHPFDPSDTIGDVHRFAYDRIVSQKDQITFDRTWVEHNKQRLEESRTLSTLASPGSAGGSSPDLILSLAWDTSGG
jgi:hypothetical protein